MSFLAIWSSIAGHMFASSRAWAMLRGVAPPRGSEGLHAPPPVHLSHVSTDQVFGDGPHRVHRGVRILSRHDEHRDLRQSGSDAGGSPAVPGQDDELLAILLHQRRLHQANRLDRGEHLRVEVVRVGLQLAGIK